MPRHTPISTSVIGAVAGAIAIGVLAGACLPAGTTRHSARSSERVGDRVDAKRPSPARAVSTRDQAPSLVAGQNHGVGVGESKSGSPVPMAP